MSIKSINGYRLNIRSSVRSLWSSVSDYFEFYDDMMLAIERAYTQAWYEGAKMYGINPEDMTQEEHNRLRGEVLRETSYIDGFAQAIISNNKFAGGKLEPLFFRAELWVSGYTRILNIAKTLAAKDQKLEWIYGDTVHCRDCENLNGRVYRSSIWNKHGILPKSYGLACHGYHCQCELTPTNKPSTRGRPPSLKG